MNTRQAIQPSNTPQVLSLSFSSSRNRFVAGLSDSLRVFRIDNCLTTYEPAANQSSNHDSRARSSFDGGIAIAEALDDRYIAFVAGGRIPAGRDSAVVFWDSFLEKELSRFELGEPVKGLRVLGKWMLVVLAERSVVFGYQELLPPTPPPDDSEDEELEQEELKGPNKLHALHSTSHNPYALACLTNSLLVLPAQTTGQVQLVPLPSGSKRVLRAHNSAIRCMALSPSGNILATASEQGTLIRVFDTRTLDQIAEFRRGIEKAVVFGLAISDGERWVACTSDKGTVHIFDLRPPPVLATDTAPPKTAQQNQNRKSQSYATHRLSSGETKSNLSSGEGGGRSSPTTTTVQPGSIQEYYGLRPPPLSAHTPPPSALPSAMAAFKQSSWAPKVLKDVRSVASAPFYMGNESAYWQGGTAYSWTTAPGGTRRRVRNAVTRLPADPTGRAPKGVVAFVPGKEGREEGDGAVLFVLGGGVEGRWEVFDLVPQVRSEGPGGWVLVRRGFRRFMGRQFVD